MREPAAREPQAHPAGDLKAPLRESGAPDAIAEAAHRLDRAMTRLEALVGAGPRAPDLFDPANAALTAELAAVQAREQALTAAAAAASQALGRAADEVRLVLSGDEITEDAAEDDEAAPEPSALDPLEDQTEAMADPDPPPSPPAKDPAA